MSVADVNTFEPRSNAARICIALAATLVVVGVVLRLIHPAYVSFGGEQIESVALAWKSWREGGADHGLRVSVGIDMPPFYLWLLSLPVAITRDPVRVTQFVMLLNVAGLAGLFLLVRARRSATEAWLVTALCATAPWSIVFARKIWAQDVLFPFLIAFYAVFLSALDRPAPWKTWLGCLLLGVVMQIYPSAWFLLPAIVFTAWIARVRVRRQDVLIGVLLVFLLWWPYIRYQYAVDFDDWRYLFAMKFGSSENALIHVTSGRVTSGSGSSRGLVAQVFGMWQRAGGSGLDEILGERAYADWQAEPLARATTILGAGFLVVGAAATVWSFVIIARGLRARVSRVVSTKPAPILVLFASIVVLVPIEYALTHAAAISHYHIVVQPGLAVLAAAGAHALVQRTNARASWILYGALVAFAGVFALQSASLQTRLVDNPSMILGGNGPIYAGAREALDGDLSKALDDVRSGDERRAAEDAQAAALFDRSKDVLLDYSGVTGLPALTPVGGMRIEPGPDGTRMTVEVPPALVDTPDLAVRDRGEIVVRIDMTSPIDGYLTLFYLTDAVREYGRKHKVVRNVARGRNCVYVVLPAPGVRGPFRLWLGQTRCTLHSIGVRAVDAGS